MKINEAIARLQTILNKGVPSDDTRYAEEFLYSLLKTMRAKRIRQKLDQYVYLSPFNFSTIECLPLELGHFSDCPCFTSNCWILRSKVKLPKIMNHRSGLMIQSVSTIDGRVLSGSTAEKEEFSKYTMTGNTKDRLVYFIHNDRLYIKGSTTLKVVSVTALFEDPLDLTTINACDPNGEELEATCFDPLDEDYPIDMDIFDDVEAMILDKILKGMEPQQVDDENDAKAAEKKSE